MEERIRHQQEFAYFPVELAPAFRFVQLNRQKQLEKEKVQIGDVKIETIPLYYPGGAYGYRIPHKGKTIVFATDAEYKDHSGDALKLYID
ncbi:MAG: hypothetical protein SRB1_00778 [Desulfobacteraceae bacterium Eth-SRB1]|nr:MAG: hypothetical protein SRB1_00778 [Desulfobacteraceae bacterium Eth-SRB1]